MEHEGRIVLIKKRKRTSGGALKHTKAQLNSRAFVPAEKVIAKLRRRLLKAKRLAQASSVEKRLDSPRRPQRRIPQKR